MGAVARLLKVRPDLGEARIEFKGEASRDSIDWLQPDSGVFQVRAVPNELSARSAPGVLGMVD
jgi:hypothetical protein